MYIYISQNKSRLWKNKFKYIGIFILCWAIVVHGSCLLYMCLYKVPVEVAAEEMALLARNIGYAIPFLP
jgi:hypothetical protein